VSVATTTTLRLDDMDEEEYDFEDVEQTELQERVQEVLATLPDDQREVLEFRLFDEMKFHEIAAEMGISTQRVKALYSQATAAFAATYGSHNE
jgi:RNA polymerase sigma factor (sigma-70 family)